MILRSGITADKEPASAQRSRPLTKSFKMITKNNDILLIPYVYYHSTSLSELMAE